MLNGFVPAGEACFSPCPTTSQTCQADMAQLIQLLDEGVTGDTEKSFMRGGSSAFTAEDCEE